MVCCDWLSIRFYLLRLILRDRFSFGAKQCWVWRRNSDRLGSKATAGLRQAPIALMPRMRLNLNLIWGGANVQAVDKKSLSTPQELVCPTRERSCSPHRLIQAAHNLLRQLPEHAHINLSAARTHRRERRWIRPTASGQVWSARIAMMATQSLTERCAVETLRTLDGAAMNCHMRTRP